jgi:putative ABC transport system ATP-binding protein
MIRIVNLTKHYREADHIRPVLTNVNAVIEDGEIAAVIGRSGSGKSTLLNLLAGLDVPVSGEIWFGETCITNMDDRARTLFRRKHIGFVFQFFNLIPTLTVGENVLLTAELNGWNDREAHSQVERWLSLVGLLDRIEIYPDKLSGGEQQRVAIARAFCSDPELILADEPTGNLDSETGADVMRTVVDLARDQRKSMVIVTHSNEVASIADRTMKLDHGQLAVLRKDTLDSPKDSHALA